MTATKGTFSVEKTDGSRWDLPVELLAPGASLVSVGDRLIAYRDVAGPGATGHLHVEILSTSAAELQTAAVVIEDINQGLDQVDLVLGDDRVAELVRQHSLEIRRPVPAALSQSLLL